MVDCCFSVDLHCFVVPGWHCLTSGRFGGSIEFGSDIVMNRTLEHDQNFVLQLLR